MEDVNRNLWDLPYKIVLKKLRMASPTLTETLNEPDAERLVASLFPDGEDIVPNPLPPIKWDHGNDVTLEEVQMAIKIRQDKAGNKKASGWPKTCGVALFAKGNDVEGHRMLHILLTAEGIP